MNLPLFLAKRIYASNEAGRQVSKPAIHIATAGVAIGLTVMIVSICVIFGFKHTIRDKITGLAQHVSVGNFSLYHGDESRPIDANDSIMNILKKTPHWQHTQRYAMTQGILKTDEDFIGVIFKGIAADYDTTFIHNSMKSGCIPKFSDEKNGNKILISQNIADKLKVKTGDRIFSYFINNGDVKVRRLTISGIYQTNMTKYDENLVFADLYMARKINGWTEGQVTGIEIRLADYNAIPEAGDFLVKNINRRTDKYGETYSSETIYETYPQIFSWLDLLDLNVWIIIALMTCVAGITIVSGLLIIILERTNMIGILKALGGRNKTIRHTFMWFAAFIIGKGIIIGDILALGIVILQKFTKIVALDASVYYVDYVPVEINIPAIIAINIMTLVACLLALLGPSFIVSHITPSKSMKYE